MTIANYITCFRLLIGPVFLFFYLEYAILGICFETMLYILVSLLALLELSDLADGYIARKFDQVTDLGKIFDPIADSIARISVFLAFTAGVIQLPIFLIIIFIYRELIVSALRTICALRGFALAARTSGKIKAIIQATVAFIIIALMFLYNRNIISLKILRVLSITVVSIACCYSIISIIEYIYVHRIYIKKIIKTNVKSDI